MFELIKSDAIIKEIVIGEGAEGIVYRGKFHGETVALKFHKERLNSKKLLTLNKELQKIKTLKSKYIISYLGSWEDETGKYCIVTEFAELGNLEAYIRSNEELNTNFKYNIAADITSGIMYLHDFAKIRHRDLKSSNILLDRGLVAKISDFGLSKTLSYISNGYEGTLPWSSPAKLNNDHIRCVINDDIYSYGMILWELAAWARPFENLFEEEIFHKVVRLDQREKIPEHIDDNFAKIIHTCWYINCEKDYHEQLSLNSFLTFFRHNQRNLRHDELTKNLHEYSDIPTYRSKLSSYRENNSNITSKNNSKSSTSSNSNIISLPYKNSKNKHDSIKLTDIQGSEKNIYDFYTSRETINPNSYKFINIELFDIKEVISEKTKLFKGHISKLSAVKTSNNIKQWEKNNSYKLNCIRDIIFADRIMFTILLAGVIGYRYYTTGGIFSKTSGLKYHNSKCCRCWDCFQINTVIFTIFFSPNTLDYVYMPHGHLDYISFNLCAFDEAQEIYIKQNNIPCDPHKLRSSSSKVCGQSVDIFLSKARSKLHFSQDRENIVKLWYGLTNWIMTNNTIFNNLRNFYT